MTGITTIKIGDTTIPEWIINMKFCHIAYDEEGLFSYCGKSNSEGEPPTCPTDYNGEAICTDCGQPTCPRCAQLSDIEDRATNDQ